jgi:hypothetical protein
MPLQLKSKSCVPGFLDPWMGSVVSTKFAMVWALLS